MSKVVDYFLKYVAFDTQSAEDAGTVPSTEKQFALAKLLSEQLKNIGVKDVSMSEHGYVYGTIPANGDYNCQTVGFLAHMDTSPDCPDENVRPQLVKHYDGKDIILNKALGVKMTTKMFPFLKNYVGQDLITTDGTTLLGADDKAGIAEIMTMAETLLTHPEIPHGTIKLAFTPDEEVGHGVDFFDVPGWGADVAYTVDGGAWGEMEYETFNAASMKVMIHGSNIHGYPRAAEGGGHGLHCQWPRGGPGGRRGHRGRQVRGRAVCQGANGPPGGRRPGPGPHRRGPRHCGPAGKGKLNSTGKATQGRRREAPPFRCLFGRHIPVQRQEGYP